MGDGDEEDQIRSDQIRSDHEVVICHVVRVWVGVEVIYTTCGCR